jgi:hypothetical protein
LWRGVQDSGIFWGLLGFRLGFWFQFGRDVRCDGSDGSIRGNIGPENKGVRGMFNRYVDDSGNGGGGGRPAPELVFGGGHVG